MKVKTSATAGFRKWFSYVMIIVLMIIMIPAIPSEASAKSIALSKYRALLNKSRISVLPQGKVVVVRRRDGDERYDEDVKYWSSKASNVKFCLGYIDGDDIPELILSDKNYGYGVWSFKKGSFRCLFWQNYYGEPVGYYYKKGIFRQYLYSGESPFEREYYKVQIGKNRQLLQSEGCQFRPNGGIKVWSYSIMVGSKEKYVSSAAYYKNLKKYTGNTKMSPIYLHNNTSANKKKYIK